jgi:hypothetical protein
LRLEDVAFSSHTDGGHLKYSTPSIMDIHGKPFEAFGEFDFVTYDVSLIDYDDMTQQVKTIACGAAFPQSNCQIMYHRAYTPQLYFMSPSVVFGGSDVSFTIDPRDAQARKSTTLPEFPFLEVRLDGYGIDFEGFLEEDTLLPLYQKSQVRGVMGDIVPNAKSDINFKFRVGQAF